ncbi:arylsulfatase A-like enzyme [Hungatella effluvii]|uniref:Arylsulfatase A-like enzyme n=1 Tax=Hungatella effluvii TaxID=1096246 RepID=A0A2V3Y6F7_9FIRM|nr:sulfatase [Hungatella effluvii]PXX53575.1 arylsulfatase A-like enzyme [Hungatella effluvii]
MAVQPNFLFIFMDDMGWRDLACTGSTFYETPNIDRLCRQGMVFANSYASCPVCSPSRASCLTGQYPARLGVTDWIDMEGTSHPLKGKLIDAPYIKHLPDGVYTIAQALKDAGYETWHVGKWHLGGREYYPDHFGFDVNIGGCSWGHPHEGYFSPYGIETLPEGPEGEYLTDRITDEAVRLLKERKAGGSRKPFYMNLCHYAVHTPIQVKDEDRERFEKKAREQGLDQETALVEGELHHTEDKKGRRVVRRVIQSDPSYAGMIWNLDQNIGRLLDALSECGEEENTVVVFTSDNGGLATSEGSPTCNLPASEGKGWVYEGGTRVPLIVKYPGHVAPGSRCDVPVTTPDFYPTFLELSGVPQKAGIPIDGRSIVPLLAGNHMPERPVFWHYPHYGNQGGTPAASVVLGDYKYIEFFEDGRGELYDLKADFSETNNICENMPEMAARLRMLLHGWQREVCARFPEVNEAYGEV